MKYVRLKKNVDFQRLFKKGKKVYSKYLTLIYTPDREKTVMGIALSKKHGKAVKRNRIKRLIRAAFSNNFDKLGGSYSIVILPRICPELSYSDVEKSLLTCFKTMDGAK
ncbi:MAG: ribonuclease P protein component [Clostridia bacterium]|nr:ribonuclease P protein component [Clostridia bacterium]MDE7084266.1 ribonuclease P protein component [Clostridia bacterium]MDE7257155.1 ribonuclease P protein component [Clostridia bacterium]